MFIKPVNAAMQSVNTFYPPPLQPAVFTIIYNYICINVLNANRCELVRERRSIYHIYYIIASRFCHINIPASKKNEFTFFPFPIICDRTPHYIIIIMITFFILSTSDIFMFISPHTYVHIFYNY